MSRSPQSGFLLLDGSVAERVEAIILRTRAYGESDKIVTFLTDDAGKLTGIAKGAKNSRRRFANCLDPFTRVRVHFRVRPVPVWFSWRAATCCSPPAEFAEPIKFAYGSYLIELVDQLTAEAQPVRELYALLAEGLEELRSGAATAAFLRGFELRLLHGAGYGPDLRDCARCHRVFEPTDRVFLDPMHGSIVCSNCRTVGESFIPVAGQTLSVLEAIKAAPLGDVRMRRFGASPPPKRRSLWVTCWRSTCRDRCDR